MPRISPTGIERRRPIRSQRTAQQRSGFTLAELLIVLALLATLSALLAPILLPSPARTLRHTAGEVAIALREARRGAQSTQQRHRFMVDTRSRRYQTGESAPWHPLPDDMTVELTTARSLLFDDERGGIDFFPDGSSTGGRIVLGLGGQSVLLDIEWLTGRIVMNEAAP